MFKKKQKRSAYVKENKMKIRFVDCIKIGFGIYVGYNLAQRLKNSIKLNINQK